MATFSPSTAVQLAINAAREAGLLDAPVRFAHALDDSGTPLQIYLANGRVILWPPTSATESATAPPTPSGLPSADASLPPDGDPSVDQSPAPPAPRSSKRRKK